MQSKVNPSKVIGHFFWRVMAILSFNASSPMLVINFFQSKMNSFIVFCAIYIRRLKIRPNVKQVLDISPTIRVSNGDTTAAIRIITNICQFWLKTLFKQIWIRNQYFRNFWRQIKGFIWKFWIHLRLDPTLCILDENIMYCYLIGVKSEIYYLTLDLDRIFQTLQVRYRKSFAWKLCLLTTDIYTKIDQSNWNKT